MKFSPILAVLVIFFSSTQVVAQQSISDEYALEIKTDGLYDYVAAFTNPRLEGRRVGTKGGLLAAQYIEDELQKMGLKQPYSEGYMQPFYITVQKVLMCWE